MRVGLHVIAVLERAGFAFIDINSDQSRFRLFAEDSPFAPGRETGATQTTQVGILE